MARKPTIEVKFTGDTAGLSKATGRVEADLKGVGAKVSGFAVGAGAAITQMGIQAIPQLVNLGKQLFSLGQSSEIALAKSRTVFGDVAGGIATWADDLNESLGLSDEAVIGLAASMGDLLIPLGFTREAAAAMSMETTELSGALSAWSQGKFDAAQVSEILTKAMLGEREGLKALGISISQVEVNQKALTIARADGREEITAQDKALATQQLILEKSTDAQTAWSDGTMDAVKSQNELAATIADAKEELAKGLVPIIQKFVSWVTRDLIPAVRRLVATFQTYWPQIRATIEPIMLQIQEIVTSVVSILSALWDRFGTTIMRLVRIAWEYIGSTIRNTMTVIQGMLDVVLGLLTGDWARAWEGIRSILSGVWDQIRTLLSTVLAQIRLLLDLAWKAIKRVASSAWEGIKTAISGAIDAIVQWMRDLPGRLLTALGNLPQVLFDAGRAILTGLHAGAVWSWGNLRKWVESLGSLLLSSIGDLARLLYNVGGDILQGLWDGMKDKWGDLTGWVGGLAGKLKSIKGPPAYDAVVLMQNGRLLIDGLLAGMRAQWPQVERFAESLAPQLSTSLSVAGRGLPARPHPTSGTTTVIQNIPTGVTPSTVLQAERQYRRTQGPL
jgi:hypothetical protein